MRRSILKTTALACAWCCALSFIAYFGWQSYAKARTHAEMTTAANKFLASLNAEQKAKATKTFDDANREDWHFIPRDRQGLPLKEMTEAQRELAHALLLTGAGAYGHKKVEDIRSLEPVLREMEGPNRRFPRDEMLYYVTIFGTPGAKDRWGWRWEGHHMSLNFTIVKGELVASTPLMFGSNPAEVRQGDRKGFRALANEQDKGNALMASLDEKQRAVAIYDAKAPGDILNMPEVKQANVLKPAGLAYSAMTKPQQAMLVAIVDEYLHRMADEQAKLRRDRLNKAGWNNVTFAWAGGTNKGDLHYYRVQGATFLIEFDNTQNNGNHIHSAWRDFNGDFGRDLIREHYQNVPHKAEAVPNGKPTEALDQPKKVAEVMTPEKGKAMGVANPEDLHIADSIEIKEKGPPLRPTITYKEKAKYTEIARNKGIEGLVTLSVVFQADQRITGIKVVHRLPFGLTEKAIEAAQKIRFKPAMKDGQAVSVRVHLEFTFNVDGGDGYLWQANVKDLVRPVIIEIPTVEYTESARQKQIAGQVVLDVVFNASGKVGEIEVLQELPEGLTGQAIKAIKNIKFQPAQANGSKLNVWDRLIVNFKPEQTPEVTFSFIK